MGNPVCSLFQKKTLISHPIELSTSRVFENRHQPAKSLVATHPQVATAAESKNTCARNRRIAPYLAAWLVANLVACSTSFKGVDRICTPIQADVDQYGIDRNRQAIGKHEGTPLTIPGFLKDPLVHSVSPKI